MNELERIFSDAHLIDFNLSKWDKMLEIWVLADHFENFNNRKPLLKVSFQKLHSIQIEFNNIDIKLDEDWQHCQWNICELIYSENSGFKKFHLVGDKPSPHISLICENVIYKRMNHSLLDTLFPGWEEPYNSLSRKGIEAMFELSFNRKK